MRRLRPLLPWLVLLLGLVGLTHDLWGRTDEIFAGKLSTDTVLTAWFHVRAAAGPLPATLDDFDFPRAYETAREFPSTADAVLLRPLVRALGFPGYWNVAVALAIGAAGLGTAAAAAALGAGPRGVLVAGLLGALCRPLWFEAVSARFNAIFPGLILLGAALGVWAIRGRGWGRAPLMALGIGLGVAGLWVYPPWALILLPVLLAMVLPALWEGDALGRGLFVVGVLVAGALLMGLLPEVAEARMGGQQCLRMTCPDRYHCADLRDLFRAAVDRRDGLTRGGLYLAPWLLAPLALGRRRWVGAGLLVGSMGLTVFALGPCPRLDGAPVLQGLFAHDPSAAPEVWCLLRRITDYGRFAAGAGLGLAVLGGLGVDAVGQGGRLRQVLGWALGIGAVAWVASVHLAEMDDPGRWQRPYVPPPARFLADAGPGVAAELPFDRSQQFLSAVAAPGRARVNPLKRRPRAGSGDPVVDWLQALGVGEVARVPSARALTATRVRWVTWDPGRCGVPSVPRLACDPSIPATLETALGPPVWREGRALAFEVSAPAP